MQNKPSLGLCLDVRGYYSRRFHVQSFGHVFQVLIKLPRKTCYVTQWSFCGDLERERAPGERSYTRSKCTEIKVYMTHEIKVYRE